MAWVHGLSCIICIRKESNISDADNLTPRLHTHTHTHARHTKNPGEDTCSSVCPVSNMDVRAVRWISSAVTRGWTRFGRGCSSSDTFCMSRCRSALRTTPLQLTHTCCSSAHVQRRNNTQKHPHKREGWQWAKLGGVTVTLLTLAASVFLPPIRLGPHALPRRPLFHTLMLRKHPTTTTTTQP